MADLPRYSDTSEDSSEGSDRESNTGTPRWVKVFGVIAIVVAVLFVIMLAAGGGRHGPGRHQLSDGGAGRETLSASFNNLSHVPSDGRDL